MSDILRFVQRDEIGAARKMLLRSGDAIAGFMSGSAVV
jgi:hypothetical protein